MTRPYAQYQDSRLWHAIATALRELEANKEIQLTTSPEYVVGYLCQELAARGIVTADGLKVRHGRELPDASESRDVEAPEA